MTTGTNATITEATATGATTIITTTITCLMLKVERSAPTVLILMIDPPYFAAQQPLQLTEEEKRLKERLAEVRAKLEAKRAKQRTEQMQRELDAMLAELAEDGSCQ
jgi:hypothetical protein